MNGVRVLVGNASRLMLELLAGTLCAADGFTVVGVASGPASVLPAIRHYTPGVVIIGARGGAATGLTLTERVAAEAPWCKVVVVTVSLEEALRDQEALRDRAIERGATAVISMEHSLSQLIHVVQGAAGVGRVRAGADPVGSLARAELTKREQDILRLTWTGASVKEVARELCLAPGTVRNLTSGCMRKLDARNRFEAARIAMERHYL
ncbi:MULTISPECIES: response regulator transcription factor [Amycolatopsis]|uniref:response regulator transcription factor n=1 Tax=Amycolatopsis sp. cg13 TaxID=3238807 RepID=UPI003524ED0C